MVALQIKTTILLKDLNMLMLMTLSVDEGGTIYAKEYQNGCIEGLQRQNKHCYKGGGVVRTGCTTWCKEEHTLCIEGHIGCGEDHEEFGGKLIIAKKEYTTCATK